MLLLFQHQLLLPLLLAGQPGQLREQRGRGRSCKLRLPRSPHSSDNPCQVSNVGAASVHLVPCMVMVTNFLLLVAHLVARHLQPWLSLLKEFANKSSNVLQGLVVHKLPLLSHDTRMESHVVHLGSQ